MFDFSVILHHALASAGRLHSRDFSYPLNRTKRKKPARRSKGRLKGRLPNAPGSRKIFEHAYCIKGVRP